LLRYIASIKKVDAYSIFQIAQLLLIEKQKYRSGLRFVDTASIKKVDAYSIFQIAQLMMSKEQNVSEWAPLKSSC